MEGVRDLRELNPQRGDIILKLSQSLENSSQTILGTFGGCFENELYHAAFGFDEELIFKPPYKGKIHQIDSISRKIPDYLGPLDYSKIYGIGHPVRTDQDGFSRQDALFYKGKEAILRALASSHYKLYLESVRDFFEIHNS